MRAFLLAVAGAAVIGFVGFVFVLVNASLATAPLQEEAEAFVAEAVTEIAGAWNGTALLNRSTPAYAEILRVGALDGMMRDGRRRAGRLRALNSTGCVIDQPSLFAPANSDKDRPPRAQCRASGSHMRAGADYRVTLVKAGLQWRIEAFDMRIDQKATP